MFKQILLAYDGSEGAKIALERAIELASAVGAKLTILASGRVPEYAETISEIQEAKEQANRFYANILEEAMNQAKEKKVEAITVIEFGKPADVIVNYAKKIEADLIILGTRQHSVLKRRVAGSTITNVLYEAKCSVLVIKHCKDKD